MRLDDEIGELKQEFRQFRVETRQRLEVIENEVTKQVGLNYNRAILDYVIEVSADAIQNMKCDRGAEELRCKQMLEMHQQRLMDLMRSGRFEESRAEITHLKEKLNSLKESMQNDGRNGCAQCMQNQFDTILSNERLLIQLRDIVLPSSAGLDRKATIDGLDPGQTTEEILEPLSNKTRLMILKCVFRGENRFTDFMGATGIEGGQLLYHLRKLTESGHLQQFESKDYILTMKGMKSIMLLAQLSQELQLSNK